MHGESSLRPSSLRPCSGVCDFESIHISTHSLLKTTQTDIVHLGFPTSFGIFQAYYSSLPQFAVDSSNIPVIGTLAQGVYYLGAPAAAAITRRYPQHQRLIILLGWPLCILGLLTASFADSVAALIVTQGLMYGVGFVVFTYPILQMVSEWWVLRSGMAFGLISAASGLAGIVMPFILDALLHRYGYKITLRACAIAMLCLTGPFIPMLKGRLPASEVVQRPKTDLSFLRRPLFWFYAVATTIQGVGFFIPPIFMPSYAIEIGLPATQAALLLAVMATAQTLGQFVFGWLSDKKLHASLLTSFCCVIAAIATATLWGLGKSLPMLLLYSIFYGFFAFGFGTMRVAMGRAVSSDQSAVLATYSIFVFLQGIGNVSVAPIMAGLVSGGVNVGQFGASRYRETVIFVASSSMLGGIIVMLFHALKWMGEAFR